MSQPPATIEVYIEQGTERAVAGALMWPGWCRIGRGQDAALQTLSSYQQRYAAVLGHTALNFPADAATLTVTETLTGDSSTNFGVPGMAPAQDAAPVDAAELARLITIMEACWQQLDAVARAAAGQPLRTGPRGGGRDLAKMLDHVSEAERSYAARLGAKIAPGTPLAAHRSAVLAAVTTVAQHGPPPPGPRGGARWSAPYFVRRAAWHVLDHAWEIEDRLITNEGD